ncbi:MAG TPA: hypothetical protein VF201_16340, partial [Nitrolancea sp.]
MIGIVLAVAFLAGVLLHDSGAGWVQAVPLIGGGIAAVLIGERWADRTIAVLALLLLALGGWRASGGADRVDPIVASVGADRSIDAVVVGLPRRETTRVTATIQLSDGNRPTIPVSLPLFPAVTSGDEIRFWAP